MCVLAKWRSLICEAYSAPMKLNSFWNKTMLAPSGRYLKNVNLPGFMSGLSSTGPPPACGSHYCFFTLSFSSPPSGSFSSDLTHGGYAPQLHSLWRNKVIQNPSLLSFSLSLPLSLTRIPTQTFPLHVWRYLTPNPSNKITPH